MSNPEEEEKQASSADHNSLIEKEIGSELFNLIDPYFKKGESLTTLD